MSKNRPNIAEKIKFWEEQDKINQAFIPRVIEMSESLQNISKQSLKNSTKVTDQAAKIDQLEKKMEKLTIELQELSLEYQNEKIPEDSSKSLNKAVLAIAIIALILSILSLVF